MVRRLLTVATIVAAAPFLTGCSSMSNTGKGALIGGGLGAGTGALVDRATGGKGGAGAIVGGIAGAVLGGAIGNEEDQKEKAVLRDRAAAAANPPVGVQDVIRLTASRTSEDVIINQIRSTNSTFQLTTEDLENLQTNNVSPRVVMEMQNRRPEMVPRTRYVAVPIGSPPIIYATTTPVFIAPPPPPPFGVGVIIRR